MKNRIHYSPEARRDLDVIWDYIAAELQNRSAAERVISCILNTVEQLEGFAGMGTPLSFAIDVRTDYRILFSGNDMVFCREQGGDVFIDRILYGRSDYRSVLFRDLPWDGTAE